MSRLINAYVYGKEWSIYPFIPPLFSLLLSLVLSPVYERVFDARLEEFLRDKGLSHLRELLWAVVSLRVLQVAYVTEVPVFVISVISAAQSNYPYLLAGLIIIILVVSIVLFPKVFMSPLDYLPMTVFPERRRPAFLAKRNWTQLKFYSIILIFLNLFFLVIIVITLPDRKN